MSDDRRNALPAMPSPATAPRGRYGETVQPATADAATRRRLATTDALFDCVELLCERLKTAGDR